MSVSLILVPLAVAAATAVSGARSGRDEKGRVVCEVHTRMRDADLLAAALRDCGAAVTVDGGQLRAAWDDVRATFRRDGEGVWSAHITGAIDEAGAVTIAQRVDAAYGRQVQRAVLERLRERAPAAGLRLESETVAEDASVRLVFEVEARS